MAVKNLSGPAAAAELSPRQKKRRSTLRLMKQNYQLYPCRSVCCAVYVYPPVRPADCV